MTLLRFRRAVALRFFAELAVLAALALAALVASGCMLGDGYSPRDRVTLAAREYNDGVRWGRYDRAAEHVPADKRSRFIERHKTVEDELEIYDYELLSIDLAGKEKATAHLEYTWTLKRVGLVEKTAIDQTWERKGSDWLVTSETRTRGAPLILFDEPIAAAK